LALNLGENVVKYDIWIQRLGVMYGGNPALSQKIDNGNLDKDIKKCCDDMFEHLHNETGLPIGYIDVVLWKGSQNKLI
jgi:peptide deformylase